MTTSTSRQGRRPSTSDHIGAIEPGRVADLMVVDGDPLQQIETIRNVIMVLRDGRLVVNQPVPFRGDGTEPR